MGRRIHVVPRNVVTPPSLPEATAQLTASLGGISVPSQAGTFGWNGLTDVALADSTTGSSQTYAIAPYATTVGSTPLWSLLSGPAGVTVDPLTGVLTKPAALAVGTYTAIVDLVATLPQVTGLTATPTSSTSIALDWSPVIGATGYTVERSPNGTGSWTSLGSTSSTSYSSSGLLASTQYFFRVKATAGAQEGLYSANASATTSSPSVGGVTSATLVVARQTYAKPTQGVANVIPDYGTTLTRVTDCAALGLQGCGPNYAQQQVWNADESLMLLYDNVGFPYVFNATAPFAKRTVKNQFNPPSGTVQAGTWKWSPIEPLSIYCCAYGVGTTGVNWNGFASHTGAVLVKITLSSDLATRTTKIVGSWPAYPRFVKNPCSEEAKLSASSQVWIGLCGAVGVIGDNDAQYPMFAWAHNATASEAAGSNVTSAVIDLTPSSVAYNTVTGNPTAYGMPFYRIPDNVNISPKADQILICWGSGDDQRWFGKELWDFSGNFIKQVEGTNDHADVVLDASGNSWYVFGGDDQARFQKGAFSGATRTVTQLLQQPFVTGFPSNNAHHFSGRHTVGKNFSAWSHQFTYVDPVAGPWSAMREEIGLVYLDSTIAVPHVLRLCQSRQYYQGQWQPGDGCGAPNVSVNRSGTKVVFRTNWNTSVSGVYHNDAYIVDIP